MAGSAVFSMGSTSINTNTVLPPAYSTASPVIEWSLLGGWVGGDWFVDVTALTAGPGNQFTGVWIGLCPISPATGQWSDVYSPSGSPTVKNDGGLIQISGAAVPYNYTISVPLVGNAYEVVVYGNFSTAVTFSSSLVVHD